MLLVSRTCPWRQRSGTCSIKTSPQTAPCPSSAAGGTTEPHLRQRARSDSTVACFSLQISSLEPHDYLHQNQLHRTSRATAAVNFAFTDTAAERFPITRCFYVRFGWYYAKTCCGEADFGQQRPPQRAQRSPNRNRRPFHAIPAADRSSGSQAWRPRTPPLAEGEGGAPRDAPPTAVGPGPGAVRGCPTPRSGRSNGTLPTPTPRTGGHPLRERGHTPPPSGRTWQQAASPRARLGSAPAPPGSPARPRERCRPRAPDGKWRRRRYGAGRAAGPAPAAGPMPGGEGVAQGARGVGRCL